VGFNDILQALFRWIHFLAGITWIGLLYYFNLINAHFQGALSADVRKQVVPEIMPRTLWWFRWGAMFTFISGLLLIIWKYFLLGSGFTGESGLMSTPGGLWITLAGLFGTVMWFNVWFIIWPAQRQIITWVKQGQSPPEQAALAKRATLASRTNTFLSVPLLFGMFAGAGHYAVPFNLLWVIVVLVLGFGLAYYMIFKFASGVAKTWP
jgi:uncharacterized membrane protein